MQDLEKLVENETFDGRNIISVCEEMLHIYEKSISIEHWRQYYFVRRFSSKGVSENLFELQCGTEGFSDCVENIVKNGATYRVKASDATKLLEKTAALYDRQVSAAQKKFQKAQDKKNQQLDSNEIIR